MKYPPITYNLLKEKKACKEQLDLFEQRIGLNKPIPLTKKTIQKFSQLFDLDWAANNLLDLDDQNEYKKAMAPAYAEYLKADETAYSKYQKAKDILLAEYNKAKDPVQAEFKKAIATAFAEYDKAKATVFVRLYKQGLTSE
jgi:hypothetical protein